MPFGFMKNTSRGSAAAACGAGEDAVARVGSGVPALAEHAVAAAAAIARAEGAQRRLQFQGISAMVLPVRVLAEAG